MNSGRMRSRIEIVGQTLVEDGEGGYVEGWGPIAHVYGEVTRSGAAQVERPVGGVIVTIAQYEIRIRYRTDVETTQRIVTDGQTLEVIGVSEESRPRRRQLLLLCEATSPDAED